MRRVPEWFEKRPPYERKIKMGARKNLKQYGGYLSGFIKPGNRFLKRKASKKVRATDDDDIPNGCFFKRLWGWWEWS
jgi:hypothetical protein